VSDPLHLLRQVGIQLQQEGKTPSLALFKARLSGQLAAPVLFAAYQQWRSQNPVSAEFQEIPAPSQKTETQPENMSLQQQLDRIEAKLDILLSRLKD